jgi:hypothetical protein
VRLVVILLVLAGCADTDPPAMRTLVTVIATEQGQAANEATDRLIAYGRRSLVVLEAAIHTADPAGRKRLVRAMRRLGDRDAVPLLSHIARYDEDEGVRKEASDALAALSP